VGPVGKYELDAASLERAFDLGNGARHRVDQAALETGQRIVRDHGPI
jgi:hypothetical protein